MTISKFHKQHNNQGSKMQNILIIGNGAREHAIAWAIDKSSQDKQLFCFATAVNPGIQKLCQDYKIGDILDNEAVLSYAQKAQISLVVIGPEAPLEKGLADALEAVDIACIGPKQNLAQLETSKAFTRKLMQDYKLDYNPYFQSFNEMQGVREVLEQYPDNHVIKADGLCGGKGVKVFGDHLYSIDESLAYCQSIIDGGSSFVIEEKLEGEEFSLISLCDGQTLLHFPAVQDHKRAYDGDKGPNTGGMGTYTDSDGGLPFLNQGDIQAAQVINKQVIDALQDFAKEQYKGVLYGGFMLTKDGVKVIEYNVRFGDPEAMNLLSLLETDFLTALNAITDVKLDTVTLKFQNKASVCNYIAPAGYPEKGQKGIIIDLDKATTSGNLNSKDHLVFFAAVDLQDDKLVSTGSRAVGFVGIDSDIQTAAKKSQALIAHTTQGREDDFVYRSDIGTGELLNKRITHINELCDTNHKTLDILA